MNKKQEKFPSDEQQDIIDHFVNIEGPLLVNAGPGSGKTMVTAHMVFDLIKKKEVSPEDILLISYSKAAIVELKKNIKTFSWGDGGAPDITIKNFHSLAQSFVKEILINKKNPMTLELMTEKEAITFIKKLAFKSGEFESDDPLKMAGFPINSPWFKSILFLCSQNFFKEFIPEKNQEKNNFYSLKHDISKHEVILHQELNNKEVERELCKLFCMFSDTKRRIYETSEHWMFDEWFALCLKEWEKNTPTKTYKYVIVDEFQDTSILQYSFLEKICSENEISGSKNLCCIGDLDQAIFTYNGSCSEIFQKFNLDNKEHNIKIKKIETNWRSSKEIVAISQTLIKNIKIDEDFSKTLKPCSLAPSHPVVWIKNSNAEKIFLKIKQKILKERRNNGQKKEFCIGEIAVLSPNWKMGPEKKFLNELRKHISAWAKEDLIFKNNPNIYQWLVKESEITHDHSLYQLLLLMQICDWKNGDDNANLSFWITEIIGLHIWKSEEDTKYLDAIQEFKNLKEKDNFFVWYVGKFPSTETDLIYKLKSFRDKNKVSITSISKFDKAKLIKGEIEKLSKKINEYRFFLMTFDLSDKKITSIALKITKQFKKNKTKRLYQVVNNIVWENNDEYIATPDPNKIQIMSIHKSKGREFKYVFIVNLNEGSFFQKLTKYGEKMWMPVFNEEDLKIMYAERDLKTISNKIQFLDSKMMDTKTDELTREKLKWQKNLWESHLFTLKEAIRTLYVGITRAKEYLYICSPAKSPSILIDLISDHLKDDDGDLQCIKNIF